MVQLCSGIWSLTLMVYIVEGGTCSKRRTVVLLMCACFELTMLNTKMLLIDSYCQIADMADFVYIYILYVDVVIFSWRQDLISFFFCWNKYPLYVVIKQLSYVHLLCLVFHSGHNILLLLLKQKLLSKSL